MSFNLFTKIFRFGVDGWELWLKIMRNNLIEVYNRNNKVKEKKNHTSCHFEKCRTL